MTADEVDAFLAGERTCRVASAFVHPFIRIAPELGSGKHGCVKVVRLGQCETAFDRDDHAAAGSGPEDGGDLADVRSFDGAVRRELEDVPGEHVNPARSSPARGVGRALAMFEALGAEPPQFAHEALLVAAEGKLSKRLGSSRTLPKSTPRQTSSFSRRTRRAAPRSLTRQPRAVSRPS